MIPSISNLKQEDTFSDVAICHFPTLEDVKSVLEESKLEEISLESELPLSWITSFFDGTDTDPGYENVSKLICFLVKTSRLR